MELEILRERRLLNGASVDSSFCSTMGRPLSLHLVRPLTVIYSTGPKPAVVTTGRRSKDTSDPFPTEASRPQRTILEEGPRSLVYSPTDAAFEMITNK
uniref:Uncharacterized protein n=1 Tax=Picea glauca TaxID=3330 RepID=A0A117NGI6_PICGL|nr:hypothetical protein ABT39_MTgene6290 [Picea glauca]QHR87994.1 hypothetical protein Q903MT_gene2006 [Picea sitchensis]